MADVMNAIFRLQVVKQTLVKIAYAQNKNAK